MAMIEVSGLTKRYDFGKVRGIEDMNFSVEEGELFGFIGQNGAGKSTTIRILMNFIHADKGTAKIDGLNCRTRSREIKRFTGYMPSEVQLYPEATARELLEYSCKLRGTKKDSWHEMAEYFELDTRKKFRELSMGNRRKLSIILAMAPKPRLLILDEPTGGLDPLMQDRFFQALLHARSEGATVFFSSHNLDEVQKYCSRVAIVKDGSIGMLPDINEMRMHHVTIATASDCGMLTDAVGAVDVIRSGGSIRFMIGNDSLQKLLQITSAMEITDMEIKKPSLEQQFHRIYRGEEARK